MTEFFFYTTVLFLLLAVLVLYFGSRLGSAVYVRTVSQISFLALDRICLIGTSWKVLYGTGEVNKPLEKWRVTFSAAKAM